MAEIDAVPHQADLRYVGGGGILPARVAGVDDLSGLVHHGDVEGRLLEGVDRAVQPVHAGEVRVNESVDAEEPCVDRRIVGGGDGVRVGGVVCGRRLEMLLGGGEGPLVVPAPGAADDCRHRRVPGEREIGAGGQRVVERGRDLRAGQHPQVALLVAEELAVEVRGDLAGPLRMTLRDRVPGADAPVVVRLGVPVLFAGGAEEEDRAFGMIAAHLHGLGGEKLVDDRGGVVETTLEPGVVVGAVQDHLARVASPADPTEHVVALAAGVGEAQADVVLDGGRHGSCLEVVLEAVAGGPGDVDHRRRREFRLGVEGAEGGGNVVITRHVGVVAVREDDGLGAAQPGLHGRIAHPPHGALEVDQHDLAADVAGGLEFRGGAAVDVDDRGGDAGRGCAYHSAEAGRSVHGALDQGRAARQRHAGTLEVPLVDGHALEVHVRQTDGLHDAGDVPGLGVVGGRPGGAEAEGRAVESHELLLDGLRPALFDQLVDRMIVGHGLHRCGCEQQDQQDQNEGGEETSAHFYLLVARGKEVEVRRRLFTTLVLVLLILLLAPAAVQAMTYDHAVNQLIKQGWPQAIEKKLMTFHSSSLGFRAAGTPADDAQARYIARVMKTIGLADVHLESVPIDEWNFKGASVTLPGGAPLIKSTVYRASSFGGVVGTPAAGVTAPVVYVHGGSAAEFKAAGDVSGKIVLIDFESPM